MRSKGIIHDFYVWAENQVRIKQLCEINKGQFCYPNLADISCRKCWEKSTA